MTGIFCAIDTTDLPKAEKIAAQLKGHAHGLKLGLEFFLAHGREGFARLARTDMPIFLDLKLHDIPNTVAGAMQALLPLKPQFLTLHTSGGVDMMRAAAETARTAGDQRPRLLGVTVLTSLNGGDLDAVGQGSAPGAQVLRLARLAQACGLDGVVCSPEEVQTVRRELGPDFILMVPGIRPSWASAQDQKRVMTPRDAARAGATYLVIGRPITGADHPAQAADRVMAEMA